MKSIMSSSSLVSAVASIFVSLVAVLSGDIGFAVISVLLIILLLSWEIINDSPLRSKEVLTVLTTAVVPLLIAFAADILLRVLEIVHSS